MWGPNKNRGKATILESTLALALMGIVAGAVGGLAIGIATSPKPQTSSSSSTSK
jgi:hypothetical protein